LFESLLLSGALLATGANFALLFYTYRQQQALLKGQADLARYLSYYVPASPEQAKASQEGLLNAKSLDELLARLGNEGIVSEVVPALEDSWLSPVKPHKDDKKYEYVRQPWSSR